MSVKVADGRSIKFKPLGGVPSPAVASIGVVSTSKDNPKHSVMLERIWDWHIEDVAELDETVYILDGDGSVTCEGKTHPFHKGDFVMVTEGSRVRWDIEYAALITYTCPPADKAWPELAEESRRPQTL